MTRRIPISLRVTPATKAALEKASAKNGRSLTQEIEMRIDRTFRDDAVLTELRAIRAMLDGRMHREMPR
jgi:hypothetical protein